jgi:hypothetical protein
MKFLVGGREIEVSKEQVVETMNDQEPEIVREYFVELPSGWFPPKQVLGQVTQWPRSTFTSHEAIRVLNRLGLLCRRTDELGSGRISEQSSGADETLIVLLQAEVRELRISVKVLEEAVVGLSARCDALVG